MLLGDGELTGCREGISFLFSSRHFEHLLLARSHVGVGVKMGCGEKMTMIWAWPLQFNHCPQKDPHWWYINVSYNDIKQVKFFKVSVLEDHPSLLFDAHLPVADCFSKTVICLLCFVKHLNRPHAQLAFIVYIFFQSMENKIDSIGL